MIDKKTEEPISAEQAACLIYRTSVPSPAQVGGVRDLMRRGDLRQSERRQFTTTRGAVAEFLTTQELRRAEKSLREEPAADREPRQTGARPSKAASRAARRAVPRSSAREDNNRQLRTVYRELLKDYFLSVLVYGRARDRSASYQRNVLIVRCVLLVLLVGFVGWTIHRMLNPDGPPDEPWMAAAQTRLEQDRSPERKIVEAWLAGSRVQPQLLDILPADRRPGGKAIRARFVSKIEDRRTKEWSPLLEDTIFIIAGNEVVLTESPSPADKAIEAKLSGDGAKYDPNDPNKLPPELW